MVAHHRERRGRNAGDRTRKSRRTGAGSWRAARRPLALGPDAASVAHTRTSRSSTSAASRRWSAGRRTAAQMARDRKPAGGAGPGSARERQDQGEALDRRRRAPRRSRHPRSPVERKPQGKRKRHREGRAEDDGMAERGRRAPLRPLVGPEAGHLHERPTRRKREGGADRPEPSPDLPGRQPRGAMNRNSASPPASWPARCTGPASRKGRRRAGCPRRDRPCQPARASDAATSVPGRAFTRREGAPGPSRRAECGVHEKAQELRQRELVGNAPVNARTR
jgi:hypothetical protein